VSGEAGQHEHSPRLQLLDIEQLIEATGIPRRSLEQQVKCGQFPRPIKIGRRRKWRAITVIKHLEQKDRKAGNLQ
jgi:predicted DNA-binding transcriptional regulator AlpA